MTSSVLAFSPQPAQEHPRRLDDPRRHDDRARARCAASGLLGPGWVDAVTRARSVAEVLVLASASAVAAAFIVWLATPEVAPARAAPTVGVDDTAAPASPDGVQTPTGGVRTPSSPTSGAPRREEGAVVPAVEVEGGTPVLWAAAAAALAAATAAGAYVLGRGAAAGPAVGAQPPMPSVALAATRAPEVAAPERDATDPRLDSVPADGLVDGLVAVHDLATDATLRASVEQTLRRAGIVPVLPEFGEPFTPSRHEVVGVRPCTRPEDAGRIAGVVRTGWSGRRGLIRPAQVLVHRMA